MRAGVGLAGAVVAPSREGAGVGLAGAAVVLAGGAGVARVGGCFTKKTTP